MLFSVLRHIRQTWNEKCAPLRVIYIFLIFLDLASTIQYFYYFNATVKIYCY
jgi:hypothetical protein